MDPEKSHNLQILVAALIAGAAFFFCICMLIHGLGEMIRWRVETEIWVGAGFGLACVIASFILVQMLDRRAEVPPDEDSDRESLDERLWDDFRRRTITGCAMLEGGVLVNAILCLMQPNLVSFLVALGLLGLMSYHFPTPTRIKAWYTNRLIGIAKRRDAKS